MRNDVVKAGRVPTNSRPWRQRREEDLPELSLGPFKRRMRKGQSLQRNPAVTSVDTGHEFPAAGRAVVTFTCS
jgi:hypothetical protein